MNKYSKQTIGILTITCGMSLTSTAVQAEETDLTRELLNLKNKIERLEKSQLAMEEKRKPALDNIHFSGLIEVEAGYIDGPDGDESDIVVATVELGIDAQVNPWVNGHVLILFEEDETDPPEIDEAIITIANPNASPWSLAAGRLYVPFGNFDSAAISDPLTLEIGETRETAIQFGYIANGFHALSYFFNGDTNDGGSDNIDDYGFALGYSHEGSERALGYDLGASWISNLGDSDSLQDTVTDPDNLENTVGGWGLHAKLNWSDLALIAEYLSAAESFDSADLAFAGSGARPRAWNIELDYGFKIADREAELAIAWQQSDEALALELPQTRMLASLSMSIYKNTALAIEHIHDEDYDAKDGGSDEDTDIITIQLALEF